MVAIRHVLAAAAAVSGFTLALPSKRGSTDDGFPNPNQQQLLDIEKKADGTLPNAPPPPSLKNSSLTAFQVIAFNELFEVAFFTSLLKNVSGSEPGYEWSDKTGLTSILETVIAQEELHAISALQILEHFGAFAPSPCTCKFPTTKLADAIALAETFTSVVLGTLQDASQLFATNGDDGPVRPIASIIGQEGEQNGFYRTLLNRKPSEKPFLTTSVGPFLFSFLQSFVVSCPFPLSKIDVPIFPPLKVLSGNGGTDVEPKDQKLDFSADLSTVPAAKPYLGGRGRGLFVTYFIGQSLPISVPITDVEWSGATISFQATFPFTANVAFGLSIASLTTTGNFSNPDDVPAKTLAAPGLIQVNDRIRGPGLNALDCTSPVISVEKCREKTA